MGLRKKAKKETIQRHRFGNFELRISGTKVEIEDAVYHLTKHVYNKEGSVKNTYGKEYAAISYLLSPSKEIDKKIVPKTEEEIKFGIEQVGIIVILMHYTNSIFYDSKFGTKFLNLVNDEFISKPVEEISKEADDKILDELKLVEEMKQAVKGE